MHRPLRVLQVMEATIGGTKRHLLALIRGLERGACFEVEVAAPTVRAAAFDDVSFSDEVRKAGIRQIFVPMRREISPRLGPVLLRPPAGADAARAVRRGPHPQLEGRLPGPLRRQDGQGEGGGPHSRTASSSWTRPRLAREPSTWDWSEWRVSPPTG